MLVGAAGIARVLALPIFIQLMDDESVSLIGLTLLVIPSYRDDFRCICVSQLPLSLYLMTKCQMKLHHPVTSLAQTLDYIKVARLGLFYFKDRTLDQLLLK